ncbi:MAG: DUF1501 domain-containing protein [Gemmataceae bacterium]|nr:DUF1501 domain-containing protein [Gemmataceae bacterium]
MLILGDTPGRSFTRRGVLQAGASSVLGLSWPALLQAGALEKPKAKSVILLWLWGGPAQLDTFDPKPDAPVEFRGPFASIPTTISGVRFGELFPQLAQRANQFSLLRGMHTGSNDHGVAGTIGLTGSIAGAVGLDGKPRSGQARPTTGSIIAKVRRLNSGLPSFMVVGGKLHQGKKAIVGETGGFLGSACEPFRLEYDASEAKTRIPGLELGQGLTPERLDDRRKLGDAFAALFSQAEKNFLASAWSGHVEQAFALLLRPEARNLFDLNLEMPRLRDQYGRTRFGQSCLLARRLVEKGIPFVQVNWSDHVEAEEDAGDGGWDHHYRNFQIMADRHGPWLDRAVSTLLDDLKSRGLLDSTLVVAVGEFGRSPKINDKAGRDHWEHCYSALLAGGGIQPGRVIGSSDARAERPLTRPVTPADLAATIHNAMGITSEQSQSMGLAVDGEVVHELF